jgi:hypothetical protein
MPIAQDIALLATIGAMIGIAAVATVAIFLSPLPIVEKLLSAAGPVALIATMLLVLVGASLERQTLECPNVELTGASRLAGEASSDRRERG